MRVNGARKKEKGEGIESHWGKREEGRGTDNSKISAQNSVRHKEYRGAQEKNSQKQNHDKRRVAVHERTPLTGR